MISIDNIDRDQNADCEGGLAQHSKKSASVLNS
jgi:hypothetical protein